MDVHGVALLKLDNLNHQTVRAVFARNNVHIFAEIAHSPDQRMADTEHTDLR